MHRKGYGGIDRFKLAAAILVVAIHTGPLSAWLPYADFVLTGIVARLAVPFLFMASGFFFFGKLSGERRSDSASLRKFSLRVCALYGAGILVYVPFNVYNGYFDESPGIGSILKDLVFDGTFYHLWYLPALILGTWIVFGLRAVFSEKGVLAAASALYAIALPGDSYYGLTGLSPMLTVAYDGLFMIFDYTRNGLFFAPIYIALGALAARRPLRDRPKRAYAAAFAVSMACLLGEGVALHAANWPRHDSMYAALVPAVYSLFRLLQSGEGKERLHERALSAWIYLLHPMAIVLVRAAAKLTGTVPLFVEDRIVYFLSIVFLSVLLSEAGIRLLRIRERSAPSKHRVWAEIDLDRLAHNLGQLRSVVPAGTEIMAVVKANAYGHGSYRVAKRLSEEGVRSFAVAEIDEAIELRRRGIKGELLVLGYTPTHRLSDIAGYDLTQTAVDADDAERLQACGEPLKIQVKIDTGLGRLGESFERPERILSMYRHDRLTVTGTYSHLASADRPKTEAAFTRMQFRRFEETVARIKEAGLAPGRLHIQSSYGMLNYDCAGMDMARPGIALYGLLSNEKDRTRKAVELLPALSLKTTVILVKAVRKGERIGYGGAFEAERDSVIATLSIGYADGISRELSERGGCVLIRGRKARIVGAVCMDQMLADVTDIAGVRQGDAATLIGEDGGQELTVGEMARRTGTISNEIVAAIGNRVERVYVSKPRRKRGRQINWRALALRG